MARPKAEQGNYWLLKTEPGDFSWDDLERAAGTVWDGVTNFTALRYMREVRKGDRALIYHTGNERASVGVARVVSDAYPDPKQDDPRIVAFDIEPEERLARPVTLSEVKAIPDFAGWDLVRLPRLSVMPVPPEHWTRLLALGGR
jgi:predicted RNA-binding protein with PUA-like domain